jgi:hypothetical protein
VLVVWPDLLPAVAVFQRCVPAIAGGMAPHSLGIPASEIRAALVLARAPRADWPEISEDVSAMGRVAAQAQNAAVQRGLKK